MTLTNGIEGLILMLAEAAVAEHMAAHARPMMRRRASAGGREQLDAATRLERREILAACRKAWQEMQNRRA